MLIVIAVFAIIAMMDLPELLRKRYRHDLIVYCVFYASALTLAMLLVLKIDIPSPIKGIQQFIKDTLHLGYAP